MNNYFDTILSKYRSISFSERDKGARFERLMKAYLLTDPRYANLFSKVWLWNEFPAREDFGGNDTGIDLVTLTMSGEYWAIQCKCFQEDSSICLLYTSSSNIPMTIVLAPSHLCSIK